METGGRLTIALQPGGEAGWCYYSDPVTLLEEPGDLWIETAVEQPDGQVIFGSAGPFEDCEWTEPLQAEAGVLLDPARSSFRIGLRLLADTELTEVQVRWRAVRMGGAAAPQIQPENEVKWQKWYADAEAFYIEAVPGQMQKNDKFMFICHLPEGADQLVEWSVSGEDAGTITPYGLYTAPDHVGVFEVIASLGSRQAKAYVVVKES